MFTLPKIIRILSEKLGFLESRVARNTERLNQLESKEEERLHRMEVKHKEQVEQEEHRLDTLSDAQYQKDLEDKYGHSQWAESLIKDKMRDRTTGKGRVH